MAEVSRRMGEFCVVDSLSNEELALQAQAGCRASFAELVARFQVPLLHFLLQRTGGLHDAEDLTQDVFVRAFRSLRRYHPQWRFSTWLYTIAHRLSLNARRRWRPPIDGRGLDAISSAGPSPEDLLVAAEQSDRLWSFAAGVLTSEQLTTLWLFYVEDLPLEEIAQVLGRTAGAAKGLLFRGRRKLAEALGSPLEQHEIRRADGAGADGAQADGARANFECTPGDENGALAQVASGGQRGAAEIRLWNAETKKRPPVSKPAADSLPMNKTLFKILPPRLAAELYDG